MCTKDDERALAQLLDRKAKHEELEKFLAIINKARDAVAAGRLISVQSNVEVHPSIRTIRTVEVTFYD